MDDLPPPLLLEILSRLPDSADVARCCLSSRTLNSVAPEIRSINLQCSYQRYVNSRAPLTRSTLTPFKSIFHKLVAQARILHRVSIGVGKPLGSVTYDDVEDEEDDLFLCDPVFVNSWLPRVSQDLKSVSISDFWVQSCWRRSDVLSLFSSYCQNLHEIEIKNAWLSVDGLKPMSNLTSLTLEFIRLDDETLEKVNECFPCLQVLNLIGVGGLRLPKIHLLHLKTCNWSVSNAPFTVSVIAPVLATLKLKCIKPNELLIDAPSLSDFHLSFESATTFNVKEFTSLKNLHLESTGLRNLLVGFPFGTSVHNLIVGSSKWQVPVGVSKSILELLLSAFPNISSLTLTSGAWSEFETFPGLGSLESRTQMKGLKKITAYLTVNDIEATMSAIFALLDYCSGLSEMAVFIHRDVVSNVASTVITRCTEHCSRVRWRWGTWKEETKDSWITDVA